MRPDLDQCTHQRWWFALTAIVMVGPVAVLFADNPPSKAEDSAALEKRVTALIAQLGDPQFAVREKAQVELAQIGLAAFDALNEAQSDPDVEISFRARGLLRAIQVDWAADSDPPEVKRILRGYGELSGNERRGRIDLLGRIDNRGGLAALARLVRYETDDQVARYAALKLLVPTADADARTRAQWAETLRQIAGGSERPVVAWLRLYARTLEEPSKTLDDWQRLVDHEHALWRRDEGATSESLVRDLLRWQAQLLIQEQQRDKALAVMRRSLELIEGTEKQLIDLVNWFTQQEAWEIIEESRAQFPDVFNNNPQLLYRVAEAQFKLARKEEAEKTATSALESKPDQLNIHITVAMDLQNRGLFAWSEREYALVIERGTDASFYSVRGCFLLSEMQHDLARPKDAAATLEKVVTWMDEGMKKNDVLQMIGSWGREPGAVRSRWHYFRALALAEKGDTKAQRAELEQGIDAENGDPTDADVLIALYRLPDSTAAQQQKIQDLIETAVTQFRTEIQAARQALETAPNENQQEAYKIELATASNQMAWLIGNTTGDYEEAVQASHRSLELRPDTAAYYDTLGRCYFAKGDYASAIKYQKQALRLEPHSGQMHRQLAQFEKAQAKAEKK